MNGIPSEKEKASYSSACAAAGQLGLMSLYETMFSQFGITISQILVTSFDFTSPERKRNIQYVITQLLALGIVPLLNENDPVSLNQGERCVEIVIYEKNYTLLSLGYQTFGNTFSDNDSLAALISIEMNAQLLVLLTDVQVYLLALPVLTSLPNYLMSCCCYFYRRYLSITILHHFPYRMTTSMYDKLLHRVCLIAHQRRQVPSSSIYFTETNPRKVLAIDSKVYRCSTSSLHTYRVYTLDYLQVLQ